MELLEQVEERYIETNGIKLHTVLIGEGEPIIMLHGFPEFWYSWKNIILGLKDEFKLIVPDTRGINLSDKPKGKENYKIKILVDDIKGLAEAFQLDKFILIGHNWGAIISWYFAGLYPELLKKLIIISVPHPLCMQKAFMKSKEQRKASAYVYDLIKQNAVDILRENDYQRIRETGVFDKKNAFDEQKDLEAWAQPGSLEAGCNYYRAAFDPPTRGTGVKEWDGTITVPTLVIHGMRDHAILPVTLEGLEDYVKDLKILRSDTSSHWIMDDAPELIISSIREFIKS